MSDFRDAEQTATLLADGLDEVAAVIADDLAAPVEDPELREPLERTAGNLRERARQVRDDRFKVLVVGEFKRGKSTLLNAMLGDDVMPRRAAECTAVVTLIRFGDPPGVDVIHADGRPSARLGVKEFRDQFELAVTDTVNRDAALDRFSHVERAELLYPHELLRHRVELIDSPGLGAHKVRGERTQKFLPQADAVVFVLHAMQFLKEAESHFLESVLLPLSLRNIFFVINWYNLIEGGLPADVARDKAELEEHIRLRLRDFCVIDGVDRSAERIFRVNAFDALRTRMSNEADAGALERSGVPAFEKSLARFLTEDRGRVRNEVALGAFKVAIGEVNRFIDAQESAAKKTLAEVEAESVALKPRLDRLKGIKTHIEGYLDGQSANLQDRLTTSFQNHVRKIVDRVPDAIAEFDLSLMNWKFMVAEAVADKWFREDKDRFSTKLKESLMPQVTEFLERELATWQTSVVRNELKAVSIDVEKHLVEEAAEYQRVLSEIEDRLGVGGDAIDIGDLVKRWLGSGSTRGGPGGIVLPSIEGGLLGDMSVLIGGIVTEVALEIAHQAAAAAAFAWLPWLGAAIAAVRMGWREFWIRGELREKITAGVRQQLHEMENAHAAAIRQGIRKDFEGLKRKVAGSIGEEIAFVEASLQSILERKRRGELDADEERLRLDAARSRILDVTRRLEFIAPSHASEEAAANTAEKE